MVELNLPKTGGGGNGDFAEETKYECNNICLNPNIYYQDIIAVILLSPGPKTSCQSVSQSNNHIFSPSLMSYYL
jgi:hypothetical protein